MASSHAASSSEQPTIAQHRGDNAPPQKKRLTVTFVKQIQAITNQIDEAHPSPVPIENGLEVKHNVWWWCSRERGVYVRSGR